MLGSLARLVAGTLGLIIGLIIDLAFRAIILVVIFAIMMFFFVYVVGGVGRLLGLVQ